MNGAILLFPFIVLIYATAAIDAQSAQQAIDFSGTWVLDRPASQVSREAGLTGLGAGGAPDTLHITHAANGNIVIGSEVNESQSRLYRVGGRSPIPFVDGTVMQVDSKLARDTVTVQGTGEGGATLNETLALSADRQTLTISISAVSAKTKGSSTLVYRRTTKGAPCQSWQTPCRP